MDDPDFGGLSGLEVAEDGLGFVALTDRGAIVRGRFVRDAAGRIVDVADARLATLAVPPGPVPDDFRMDTEGLAMGDAGDLYISTEFVTRILHLEAGSQTPTVLPSPRDFAGLEKNGGLEALAFGPDGALFTLPEVSRRNDGTAPLFRYRDGMWDVAARLPVDGAFLPVGADFGPDGRLYLLERKFYGVGGFASKVRRVTLGEGGITADETLLETRPGTFGNLEGIAVWRDAAGALRMTMISDDNFLPVLGTEVVEFRVPD